MTKSAYNPCPEQEAIWAAEKEKHYTAWRETKMAAALEWLASAPSKAEQTYRANRVREKFGDHFANDMERLRTNGYLETRGTADRKTARRG